MVSLLAHPWASCAVILRPADYFPQPNQPSIKHSGTLSFHACAAIQPPLWPHPSLHEFRSFPLCQHGLYDSLCSLASSLLRCGLTSSTITSHAYSNSSFRVSGIPLPSRWISQVPTKPILACCGSKDSEELQHHLHSVMLHIAFPLHPTRSAFLTMISELNTAPATSPVNA